MERIRRVLAGPWTPPELGKMPYLWLLSLGFMGWKYAYVTPSLLEMALLALTLLVFVPLYFFGFWARGWQVGACIVASSLIGALWAPHNAGAASFFIFACAMCGGVSTTRRAVPIAFAVLAFASLVSLRVDFMRMTFLLPVLTVGLPVAMSAIMDRRLHQSRAQLLRKQEEVEHFARIAERERISRDLHDLLGHSLSLIALKAELAGKLARRDMDACAREIADIETSARQALAEVRAAVTDYRQSGLAQALASARASLAAADVALTERVERFPLAPAAEHVVALALREAVTNIVRHADARRCTLSLAQEGGDAVLRVADDGQARSEAAIRRGNGLDGMRERVSAIGGRFALHVRDGLELELHVPNGVAN
ncbi:sensor histidine kinase [Massilia sp. ST3]|uniref:sensor histidine kinase n=1 Tax=Massilia sp. ST3 TaxID=2824903 RepID=UPI001B82DE94|nr:sensor histidine kinase [Massilia sp. ST3]MBQ5950048.1 sensor histidine kinase [Massilia sp. ST3]